MKTCSHCGFRMPKMSTIWVCPACRKEWPVDKGGVCAYCGKYSDWLHNSDHYCKECKAVSDALWYVKQCKDVESQYSAWLGLISKLYEPKPFTGAADTRPLPQTDILTEDDWIKACQYFDGCAICGGTIDTRMYFVDFKQGGKYTIYNIIPVCEQCATRRRGNDYQPFRYFHERLGRMPNGKAKLKKITEYLTDQMDEAFKRRARNE